MNQNVWYEVANHFKNFPQACGSQVSEKEIIEAEILLGIKFSASYKQFLLLYGGGCVADHYIYGLSRAEIMPTSLWSVIQNTDFYKDKQQWPDIKEWYVISEDGSGNPIGIDPEGKVWVSDHDADFEKTKLADNFEEFLDKILSNTLYQ